VKPFSLLIDSTVLEFLQSRSHRVQATLLARMMFIRDYPENSTDVKEFDLSGRLIRTSARGAYAISYWIDDADREVKIVKVQATKLQS
jgi:hypothetical protein